MDDKVEVCELSVVPTLSCQVLPSSLFGHLTFDHDAIGLRTFCRKKMHLLSEIKERVSHISFRQTQTPFAAKGLQASRNNYVTKNLMAISVVFVHDTICPLNMVRSIFLYSARVVLQRDSRRRLRSPRFY